MPARMPDAISDQTQHFLELDRPPARRIVVRYGWPCSLGGRPAAFDKHSLKSEDAYRNRTLPVAGGHGPFQRWLDGLADLRCRVTVLRRIDRVADGNPGDRRFCRDGVWELRVDCGPGYRVYFARPGADRMLLLGGGSKRSQSADIAAAVARWADYKERE